MTTDSKGKKVKAEFIVNIHAHPEDPEQLVISPDPVEVNINDSIRWFSDLGPHEGRIMKDPSAFDGTPWRGPQGQRSDPPLIPLRVGEFKYKVTVHKPGEAQPRDLDPTVIVS